MWMKIREEKERKHVNKWRKLNVFGQQ